MLKRLLVPVDGSKSSVRALEKSMKLGLQFESEIFVLTVAPESYITRLAPSAADHDKNINDGVFTITTEILSGAEDILKNYPFPHHSNYVVGDSAKEILKFAKENDINLIVMGNRGMGAFSRTILGSVSNKVVNSSPVSVLVVKDKDEE